MISINKIKNINEFIPLMLEICNKVISENKNKERMTKISFYKFFSNKHNNPKLLLDVAKWWIIIENLDHFEDATKIKNLLEKYKF
jgi:hypothetical protein